MKTKKIIGKLGILILTGNNMDELFEMLLDIISLGNISRKEELKNIMGDIIENPIKKKKIT